LKQGQAEIMPGFMRGGNNMAKNIESRLGNIPESVMAQFRADCDRVVKLKAAGALGALEEKYSRWGLVSNEMKANLLREMGVSPNGDKTKVIPAPAGAEMSAEERRIKADCDRYYEILEKRPMVVREMIMSNLDRKYKDSKTYIPYREDLRKRLGLTEGGK
jgi:hypothetical protein